MNEAKEQQGICRPNRGKQKTEEYSKEQQVTGMGRTEANVTQLYKLDYYSYNKQLPNVSTRHKHK
jgi:hypothetical protein